MEPKPFKLTVRRFGARVQQDFATLLEAARFALACVEENTAAPERLSEHGVVIWIQDGGGPSGITDALDRLRDILAEEQTASAPGTENTEHTKHDGNRPRQRSQTQTPMGGTKPGGQE